jgi:hypothetical protein
LESGIFNPGEDYIQLAFQLDHYLKSQLGDNTIIVDCYFGPPNLRPKKKKVDPDNLMKSIRQLRESIKKQIRENPRRTYLIKQLDAMTLLVKYGLGENISFEKRVETGLDISPVVISTERVEELNEQANRALRKEVLKGDLTSMATRWRKRAMTMGEEIIPLAQDAAADARRATEQLLFKLPPQETVEFRAVPEAPWSAYNYYQGNYQAIIEINIELPRSKYSIWKWVTHETYPGHQTQLVQQESGYHQGTHKLESTIAIINSPECTIAEGIAEAGSDILHDARPLTKPESVSNYLIQLRRAVGINALGMLHKNQRSESEVTEYLQDLGGYEEAYAKARLPFMTDPMWGPYGYTYLVGAWLVRGFFKAAQEAHLTDEFINTVYYEAHTPSTLKSRISDLKLKLPTQII